MLFQISLFSIFQTISILFMMAALYRLYAYIRRYRFNESKYTLLMGRVHLHWLVWLYISAVLGWAIVSYIVIF